MASKSEESREYYLRNRDKILAYQAEYREKNREEINRKKKQDYWDNVEVRRQTKRDAYQENRDVLIERTLQWQRQNPAKTAAKNALRKARCLQATPEWVDLKEIGQVYKEAHRLTKETGIKHEVDHIVPLVHNSVSGLHVPWNLQILTKDENARKGNTFPWQAPQQVGQLLGL